MDGLRTLDYSLYYVLSYFNIRAYVRTEQTRSRCAEADAREGKRFYPVSVNASPDP